MFHTRYKVIIRCNRCGEKYVLRGRKEKGSMQTGFKMCVCGNQSDFETNVELL